MRRGARETFGDENYHYHYNREERLALSPRLKESLEEGGGGKKGFFAVVLRGNRGMIFLLMDVAILLILFLVYSILTAGGDALWNKDGYSFRLSAYAYEEKVLVSLRITRRSWDTQKEVETRVRLGSGQVQGDPLVPKMPETRNQSVYLREVLPLASSEEVWAQVEMGRTKKRMSAPVKMD